MKKIITLFGLATAIFIIACENEVGLKESSLNNDQEYLVFGRFQGFCNPCNNTIYKVSREELAFDNVSESFPRLQYNFEKEGLLNSEDLNNSQQLIDLLPESLKNSDKDTYGCPDCADQGGYFLEFIQNGELKKVLLDSYDSEHQSKDIKDFKFALATVIQVIEG